MQAFDGVTVEKKGGEKKDGNNEREVVSGKWFVSSLRSGTATGRWATHKCHLIFAKARATVRVPSAPCEKRR
jgi:hypothetical protein